MNVKAPNQWAPETQLVSAWLALAVLLGIGTLFGLSVGFVGLVLFGTFIAALVWAVQRDVKEYPPLSPKQEIKDNWKRFSGWVAQQYRNRQALEFGNDFPVKNQNENPVSNSTVNDYPAGNPNLYTYEVENGSTSVTSEGDLTHVGLVEGPYEPEDTVVLDIRYDDGTTILKEK